jgi:penicillin-binding protein 1A
MAQRNRRRQRRRGGARSKLLFVGAGLLVAVALAGIAVASWVLNVAADAPSLAACKKIDRGGNSAIFAADGSKLGLIDSDEARAPVAIERIPKQLQLATVAIEDQRFYEHGGIDPEGIARAALKNLEAGKTVEGGSTITQQLVRNLCIRNPKRNLERKIIEAQLALEYAERHSRREILDQYLNTASYGTVEGATAIGVGAASKIYFSKPVWKLKLGQAALLAGLPQAPSQYNPILHPRQARERRDAVLAKMANLGYISPARAKQLEQRGLGLDVSGSYFAHREPFFFDYVENELIERYGADTVRNGGLRVYTTLDPRLQEAGLAGMRSALPYTTDPSSALVSIDPGNGDIEAMVSSSSYDSSQFNLAAQGHRQPGSTFKAFVLTTAIKQGIDPYSTYYTSKPLDLDLPKWGHWEVHTADEGYLGRVNLQQATVASDNTVFAQLDLDVGPQRVAETAHSMGITSPLDGIPAEGIGGLRVGVSPLEMADAYATLASGGIRHDPVAIRRVAFPGGKVERPDREPPRRVISEAVAHEVTRLLHDNITEGTGTAA